MIGQNLGECLASHLLQQCGRTIDISEEESEVLVVLSRTTAG
jgi:hypothetical protein